MQQDKNMTYKAFDVVLVNFGSIEDAEEGEQCGIRPAIIIQNDIGNFYSDTTIVIPCTTRIKNIEQSTHSLLDAGCGGLTKDSMLLGECIRQVSKKRIIKKIGTISDRETKLEVKRVLNNAFAEVA